MQTSTRYSEDVPAYQKPVIQAKTFKS